MHSVSDKITSKILVHAVDLLRVADGMMRPVLRDLNRLEKELLRDLENAAGKTAFKLARMRALLVQTRQTIASAFKSIAVTNEKGLITVVDAVGRQTASALNAAIGASVVSVGWSPQQVASIAKNTLIEGRVARDWWSQQSASLRERFATQMRLGQLRGEGIDELARRVRGTKAMAFKDGIMQATRAQSRTLVRTAVLGVSNDARLQTYLDNRDVIKGVVHISTLDASTTPECISRDHLAWNFPNEGDAHIDYKPVGHDKEFIEPPLHWQCRSVLSPVTFSWEELAGEHGNTKAAKIADKVPPGKRASMDGQVSAKLTMEEWLKSRSDAEIDAQLGKGKAEMFRAGKIGASDLTDSRNNPLTLEQLKSRAGEG